MSNEKFGKYHSIPVVMHIKADTIKAAYNMLWHEMRTLTDRSQGNMQWESAEEDWVDADGNFISADESDRISEEVFMANLAGRHSRAKGKSK